MDILIKWLLQTWLRWQFKLVDACGYCVDVDDTFSKTYAIEARDVFVVGVFDQ